MAANHSRLRLMLAILLTLVSVNVAQAQSSDGESLGDVARTQRQKKPAAKVIDDDEMTRRGLGHGSVKVPFECSGDCVLHAKADTSYGNGEFRNATEQQWQDAFAAALADLAQGDWAQRLSEIREEACSNSGNGYATRLHDLENDMFAKLLLETRSKNIDETAAAHPNDASGVEALRQLRVERMKHAILYGKVEIIAHSCASAAKAPGK
jgi:hypothetical protein